MIGWGKSQERRKICPPYNRRRYAAETAVAALATIVLLAAVAGAPARMPLWSLEWGGKGISPWGLRGVLVVSWASERGIVGIKMICSRLWRLSSGARCARSCVHCDGRTGRNCIKFMINGASTSRRQRLFRKLWLNWTLSWMPRWMQISFKKIELVDRFSKYLTTISQNDAPKFVPKIGILMGN